MRTTKRFIGTLAGLCLLAATGGAHATLLGPSPYLSFADSPFSGLGLGTFYLEDFEDDVLNTPGVTATGSGIQLSTDFGPTLTDSIDADDGVLDGDCFGSPHSDDCQAYWANGNPGFTLTFDAIVLGALPTHVGVVWTDGAGTIHFEAFDENGASLGTLDGNHADGTHVSNSSDDRFYGAINAGGVSSIHIWNTAGGIEIDHLQYGLDAGAVPEPGTLALIGLALAGLASRRRG